MRKSLLASLVVLAALVGFMPTPSALAAGTTSGADLQVSGSSNLGSPVQGQPYVYTYQVKNSGPQDATAVTFTDDLTAGSLAYAAVNGIPSFCSNAPDGTGGTAISCNLFTIVKGSQSTVTVSVNAPSTIGPFSNTGTASSTVDDPQPANNSSTVTVKVGSAACPLPAGQPTVTGMITNKLYDSSGLLDGFLLSGNDGVQYTVLANFFSSPVTTTINLLCKVVPPTLYIQPFTTDNVTGPIDMEVLPGNTVATPVVHASVVQTPYWTDKVA